MPTESRSSSSPRRDELPDVLTYEDVRRFLQLDSERQVSHLRRRPDPLPVFYLTRRTPRVRKADFLAWLDRHHEAGHDRRAGEPACSPEPLRVGRPRQAGGRPLDSIRRRLR